MISLTKFVADFASGLERADKKRPYANNQRSKKKFQPGIGPHTEAETIRLVISELQETCPADYERTELGVPYPATRRQRCDLAVRTDELTLFLEVKMLRLIGDNGKVNDNMLMHILSPYPQHRSAVTDCEKLARSNFPGKKAIMIYGYTHEEWPLEPAVRAFEALATSSARLGPRVQREFTGLCHPVHRSGCAFGWELLTD